MWHAQVNVRVFVRLLFLPLPGAPLIVHVGYSSVYELWFSNYSKNANEGDLSLDCISFVLVYMCLIYTPIDLHWRAASDSSLWLFHFPSESLYCVYCFPFLFYGPVYVCICIWLCPLASSCNSWSLLRTAIDGLSSVLYWLKAQLSILNNERYWNMQIPNLCLCVRYTGNRDTRWTVTDRLNVYEPYAVQLDEALPCTHRHCSGLYPLTHSPKKVFSNHLLLLYRDHLVWPFWSVFLFELHSWVCAP